jgi:aldose 1-epimerase
LDSIIFGGSSLYQLKTKRARFDINPDEGGQWLALQLGSQLSDDTISVLSGYKHPDPFFASGSFLMFPWVNRLNPNPWAKAPFYPSTHWLTDGNGLSLHGLYHNLSRQIVAELTTNKESRASFCFILPDEWKHTQLSQIKIIETFVLSDSELKIEYTVQNMSDSDFEFALGIHPYFSLGEDSNIDDLYLFGTGFHEVKLGDFLLPERILENEIRLIEECKLEGKHFDSLFKSVPEKGQNSYIGFFSMNRKERVIVGGANFYQVYTPPDRKSLAIEPMTATGNFLNFSQEYTEKIVPSEIKRIEFFIRLENF